MAPTAITGKVVRYYYDQSGYVTAMDIDTGSGIQLVQFTAEMGQELYGTYPIGSNVSVYATASSEMGATSYDLVSIGASAPAPGSWMGWRAHHINDIDLLESTPYLVAGEKEVVLHGRLTRLIANRNGEVIGMILDKVWIHDPNHEVAWREASLAPDGESDWAHDSGRLHGPVLVRVPPELRNNVNGSTNGTERITPMFKSAPVTVVGYLEAPHLGSVSRFHARVAAEAITVNHRSVGIVGFARMEPGTETLFNWDIGGNISSTDQMRASHMGYTIYNGDEVETPGSAMNSNAAGGSVSH